MGARSKTNYNKSVCRLILLFIPSLTKATDICFFNIIPFLQIIYLFTTKTTVVLLESGYADIKRMVMLMIYQVEVHVYGCFSQQGFRQVFTFTQNLNAELIITLYNKGLLKSSKPYTGQTQVIGS